MSISLSVFVFTLELGVFNQSILIKIECHDLFTAGNTLAVCCPLTKPAMLFSIQ